MASDAALRGPLQGSLRAARAGVFGTAAVSLAALAHLAGGGAVPSLPVLALLAVPVAWVAVALTRRSRGPVALGAALLVTQALLHESLMALSGMACAPLADGTANGSLAGMSAMAGMAGMPAGAVMTCTGTPSVAAALPGTAMSVAHLAATAASALLLARGERLLVSVMALLLHVAAAVRLPRQLRAGRPAAATARIHTAAWVPSPSPVLHHVRRRGPPSLATA
jgi:hypothetical protein